MAINAVVGPSPPGRIAHQSGPCLAPYRQVRTVEFPTRVAAKCAFDRGQIVSETSRNSNASPSENVLAANTVLDFGGLLGLDVMVWSLL